jgi:hypothetical protein
MSAQPTLIDDLNEWDKLRRNHQCRILIAAMIRQKSTMRNQCIVERPCLGDSSGTCGNVIAYHRSKQAGKLLQLDAEIT